MFDIAGLKRDLGAIQNTDTAGMLKAKARDYYWYSPILKRQLDDVLADLIVTPVDETELVATVKACVARAIPLTPRGAGTGNYGQAMPLKGGVVVDLSRMEGTTRVNDGRVRAAAGCKILTLDKHTQTEVGMEMRMHPTTLRTATIGGFVCGGSGGVGSVTWGGLRDRGNVLGLRVVTMEAEPRIVELRGDDVQKVIHAYGTNGIVTEVELPLVTAHAWIGAIVGFDNFASAARFGHALAAQDALLKKLVSTVSAPICQTYLGDLKAIIPAGRHVVMTMIAPIAWDSFASMLKAWGADLLFRSDQQPGLPPVYEYTWNHTTLQALKVDRTITYNQIFYPPPSHVDIANRLEQTMANDVLHHLEFARFDGQITCYGLPIIRYSTDERLAAINAEYEAAGCSTFDPHSFTLEEGGMKKVDEVQLAFKRETDPGGLLNPGKMLAWDHPDYRPSDRLHLFPAASAGE